MYNKFWLVKHVQNVTMQQILQKFKENWKFEKISNEKC